MEDSFRYDVRVRDRLLKKGLLKQDEVDKHLAALADVEAQSEPVSIEQPAVSSHGDSGR
jgi:hypothetical protein